MKNIFIKAISLTGIAFFLNTAVAQAQVTSDMRDYNSNVNFTNDTMWFWVPLSTMHIWNFNQNNISANDVTYRFYKTDIVMADSSHSNFCVFHNNDQGDPQSQCFLPSVTQSTPFITEAGEFNTLQADFVAGTVPGISIVRYRVVDIANPADSIFLVLIYNAAPVGVAEAQGVNVSEPYPNPSNGNVAVNFAFTNADAGNATVTDVAGNVVYSQAILGSNGILNIETSSWAKGVYMLSLTDENGIAVRRKIVVQ